MVRFLISPTCTRDLLEGLEDARSAATLLGPPKRLIASGHMVFTQCILIQKGGGWIHIQQESVRLTASTCVGSAGLDAVTHRPKMS